MKQQLRQQVRQAVLLLLLVSKAAGWMLGRQRVMAAAAALQQLRSVRQQQLSAVGMLGLTLMAQQLMPVHRRRGAARGLEAGKPGNQPPQAYAAVNLLWGMCVCFIMG
jgi:hypothetical protein